ncbi:MAG: AIPR family protein [Ktedonobacterales bacterium]
MSYINDIATDDLPEYLKNYDVLAQHIRAQLEGLTSTERGRAFAQFVQVLVPHTDSGSEYAAPILSSKESNDEGVDLTARSRDGNHNLHIQSKLFIDRADTIDSIMSKFHAYSLSSSAKGSHNGTEQLIFNFANEQSRYMVVTLSPLDGVRKNYLKRQYSSRSFYDQLQKEGRIYFVDGYVTLSLLRAAFRKLHEVPSDIRLNFETPVISMGGVYFGIASSSELKRIYAQFGDALFFENIRDFQGLGPRKEGRTTVNDEIVKTIKQSPEKMLERNNGIVFRASKVHLGSSPSQLILDEGSVINGCQTTMCLVEHASEPCYVSVKVVETENSWDVAKSANYQNPVDVIDLDLARNLRPQLAKRTAALHGIQIDDGKRDSAFQIIDRLYQQRVAYHETRLLYIGVFSRSPNNVFASNYTELMPDLIRRFSESDPLGENVLSTLFAVQDAAQKGLRAAQETFTNPSYAPIFERLYDEDHLSYRSFLAILSLCGLVGTDVSARVAEPAGEFQRMSTFLQDSQNSLNRTPERFVRYYRHAVKIWMQDTLADGNEETRQAMHGRSRRSNFSALYQKICMEADADDQLQ